MDDQVKKLEEKLAFLQLDLQQMSDELFSQQREITMLKVKILNLEDKVKSLDHQNGILHPEDDSPPPHY